MPDDRPHCRRCQMRMVRDHPGTTCGFCREDRLAGWVIRMAIVLPVVVGAFLIYGAGGCA